MTAVYDPPYDSPIEEILAWNIIKYISDQTLLTKQVEFDTLCGTFRVDFVAHNDRTIGLECDGQDYHNQGRDEWRDAMLLGSNALDAVYHFPGNGIFYHVEGCLAALLKWEPQLFSTRGQINLGILAPDVVKKQVDQDQIMIFVPWPSTFDNRRRDESDEPQHRSIQGFNVKRTSNTASTAFWREIYAFAVAQGSGDLDSIIASWRAK